MRNEGVARWGLRLLLAGMCAGPGLACSGEPAGSPPEAAAPAAGAAPAAVPATEAQARPAPTPAPIDTVRDGRTPAQRLQDATIAARIRLALVEDAGLRPFNFTPVVEAGRVTLQGAVQTAEQQQRALAVARQVEGVRDVVNVVTAAGAPVVAEAAPAPAPATSPPATPPVAQPAAPAGGTARPTQPAAGAAAQPPPPAAQPRQTQAAPAQPEKKEEARPEASSSVHTVRNGESLWTISQRYGVTVDRIKRLNNLRSNSLRPGQTIRVK